MTVLVRMVSYFALMLGKVWRLKGVRITTSIREIRIMVLVYFVDDSSFCCAWRFILFWLGVLFVVGSPPIGLRFQRMQLFLSFYPYKEIRERQK